MLYPLSIQIVIRSFYHIWHRICYRALSRLRFHLIIANLPGAHFNFAQPLLFLRIRGRKHAYHSQTHTGYSFTTLPLRLFLINGFNSNPSTEGVESTRGNSVCLCVCLSVCLSVITFSFLEYSIIWWSRPCKPYIFWKLIMQATSTALFWPSTTEYQPVPPSTDPVFNDLIVYTM